MNKGMTIGFHGMLRTNGGVRTDALAAIFDHSIVDDVQSSRIAASASIADFAEPWSAAPSSMLACPSLCIYCTFRSEPHIMVDSM